MEDNQNAGGGAAAGAGGAGSGSPGDSAGNNQSNGGGNPPPKTVSWDTYERVSKDMHKYKEQLRTLETRLGDVEAEKLKATNDYKSLYEQEQQKRKAAEDEKQKLSNWIVQTQRFNAVKDAAVKAGLREQALPDLELVDMATVSVESTSTGRFVVSGAKERVESLKSERPHWFGTVDPPRINGGGGGAPPAGGVGGNDKPTAMDVNNAERDWKRGKIKRQQYEETYKKYCAQNPAYATPGAVPTDRSKG